MGDALCGPSNALQNFQKHTAVDRTLQQDRLIARRIPSQGFRSQGLQQGTFDPEFAEFEAGHSVPGFENSQNGRVFLPPGSSAPLATQPETLDWAADFQRLRVTEPSHAGQQRHTPIPVSGVTKTQGSWHHDFLQQSQRHGSPAQEQSNGFHPAFHSAFTPSYLQTQSMNAFQPQEVIEANAPVAAQAFDESAFEAAFEQARADLETQSTGVIAEAFSEVVAETTDALSAGDQVAVEKIKIGSDTIPFVEKADTNARLNDHDELAETAGHLLARVQHDHSQKFRESNFLALMRRIRDREVHIEGDEFRESSQPLHPGGKYYPEGESRSTRPIEHSQGQGKITADDINSKDPPHLPSEVGAAAASRLHHDPTTATPYGDTNSLYAGVSNEQVSA